MEMSADSTETAVEEVSDRAPHGGEAAEGGNEVPDEAPAEDEGSVANATVGDEPYTAYLVARTLCFLTILTIPIASGLWFAMS